MNEQGSLIVQTDFSFGIDDDGGGGGVGWRRW